MQMEAVSAFEEARVVANLKNKIQRHNDQADKPTTTVFQCPTCGGILVNHSLTGLYSDIKTPRSR